MTASCISELPKMLKNQNHQSRFVRITVCGARGSGKTSLIEQLVYGIPPVRKKAQPTIEDIYACFVETERGVREKVFIHDTQGIDSSNYDIPRTLMPHTDAFILVYAVNDVESYNIMEQLKKDIDKNLSKKDVHFLIIGTKLDLKQRRVEAAVALNWAAREKVRLIEVSSLDRRSLVEPLQYIMNKVIQTQSKSTFGRPKLGARSNTIANIND
ncbi:NF-kappa-B inhibitor-interacting Ras-like protein 1 isoform X2 [Varroa destructor]|uniref:NF-kappa-B inhibitor-interacting Ras-like protein 2 n=2 Tax=Varroa TaxID=62624 RepID=A0A7M7JFL0_VARDE|nr:NF-kappa-B inhibitor-interacting Ras-like protein 1 isoform X2 [Varroa destructor]